MFLFFIFFLFARTIFEKKKQNKHIKHKTLENKNKCKHTATLGFQLRWEQRLLQRLNHVSDCKKTKQKQKNTKKKNKKLFFFISVCQVRSGNIKASFVRKTKKIKKK